jgi:tetratricopeptide (TPR) repeat protein/CHAT domain-containing protein
MMRKKLPLLLMVMLLSMLALPLHAQKWSQYNQRMIRQYTDGQLDSAIITGRIALQLAAKEFHKKGPDYGTALFNLAFVLSASSDPASAIDVYLQCIEVRKKNPGELSKEYINAVNNLAELYYQLEQYKDVEPWYRELLRIIAMKDGTKSKDYSICCQNMGSLFMDAGIPDSSMLYYKRALETLDSAGLNNDENYLYILNLLAFNHYKAARYPEAIVLYTRLAELRKQIQGDSSPDYATTLNNLAMSYRENKQYDQGRVYLLQVLELRKKTSGEMSADYAFTLNNLASLLVDQYQWKEALPMLKRVLEIRKVNPGKDSSDLTFSMNNLAYVYSNLNVFDTAVMLYKQVADIRGSALGEQHPAYASALFELAACLKDQGNYSEAERLYLRCAEMEKNIYGEKSVEYATVMNNLGALYWTREDFQKAGEFYERSLAIKSEVVGEQSQDYAICLQNIALLHKDMGEEDTAYAELIRARDIFVRLGLEKTPEYVVLLNSLAGIYLDREMFDNVEPLYREALSISETVSGKESKDYAGLLAGLGYYYRVLGNYAAAEPLYLEALRIREKIFGHQHKDYAGNLIDLGNLYYYTGEFPKAAKMFHEAIGIYAAVLGTSNQTYAASLESLGNLYRRMGNFAKAEELYLQSMQIKQGLYGEMNEHYAMVLSNLAGCYKDQGKYRQAEPLYLKAIEIQKTLFTEKNTTYATYIDNLGVLYALMKQYDKAMSCYTEALEFYKKKLGPDHPELAYTMNNIGTLCLAKGDYSTAAAYFKNSLQIREKAQGVDHPDYALALNDLAYAYFLMGDMDAAAPWYAQANEKTLFQIRQNYPVLSEREKALFFDLVDNNFNGFNRFVSKRVSTDPSLAGDALNNLLATGSILLEDSRNLRTRVLSSGDSTIHNLYARWSMMKSEIGRIYMMTAAERIAKGLNPSSLESKANEMEKELSERMQAAGYAMPLAAQWQDIRAALHPGEAVVDFVMYDFTDPASKKDSVLYAALVLTSDASNPFWVPLFEERSLYALLSDTSIAYADAGTRGLKVNSHGMGPRYGPLNTGLYPLVWKPLEASLQGVSVVYITAAGLLNKLSFAALKPDSSTYLCDRYDIRYLLSSRDLLSSRSKDKAVRGMQAVLAGAADYNTGIPAPLRSSSEVWKYLPGTQQEVDEASLLLKNAGFAVTGLKGSAASEAAVKALSGSKAPDVLHLSTHGFFFSREAVNEGKLNDPLSVFKSAENPLLRSGLILSGANAAWSGIPAEEGEEDGILTAWEVSNMDLNKTRLVVLSACETGLGDIRAGEGVYGLQRAFRLAGAGCILLSLWEVPDAETTMLMQSFYREWTAGSTIHDAFRKAQDGMRKQYPSEPSKWAGFILIE